MRSALLLGFAFCLISLNVRAHEEGVGHTPNYCSVENKSVCAHLKFLNVLTTSTEGHFISHILVPNGESVQNLKLDLWMDMGGHGHGSSPVDISSIEEANHFEIKNAWFVMKGTWLVRIDFALKGEHYHIEIPVEITQ